MIVQFWPCPGCSRHVKRGDPTCPFCGATASVESGPTRTIAGRLSRAALFAAGAMGTAVATTACGAKESSASDDHSVVAPEAGDASTTTGPTDSGDASAATGPTDSSSAVDVPVSSQPPYGSPVIGQPVYGAAFIPDE